MRGFLTTLLLPAVITALPTLSSSRDTFFSKREPILLTRYNHLCSRSSGDVCAGNDATSRSEWCDYNLQTDYYNDYPDTGVVRSYTFNIQNITLSPDGVPRMVQAINGQIPGPSIEGNVRLACSPPLIAFEVIS